MTSSTGIRRHRVLTSAGYVGRVGALAIALGIGGAMAGATGTAWAAPSQDDSDQKTATDSPRQSRAAADKRVAKQTGRRTATRVLPPSRVAAAAAGVANPRTDLISADSVSPNPLRVKLSPRPDTVPQLPAESELLWGLGGWARRSSAQHPARAAHAEESDEVASSSGLPEDLERTTLVTGLDEATDFQFLPDGRILFTEKGGAIKVYADGVLNPQPMITFSPATGGERGLTGLAVDPDFAENHYIYVAYTTGDNHDRLSRLTVDGNTIDPASEAVLMESPEISGSYHHGGSLAFGPDDKLYWGVGDNLYTPNSQSLSSMHGKIMRLDPSKYDPTDPAATAPADNPFVNTPGAVPQIYALGFRNPFRLTFTPNGKLLVGDVGGAAWEELNIVTKGANYGWPLAEGPCDSCGFVNPIYAYEHVGSAKAGSITSVMVYTSDVLGEDYTGKVFIADYTVGWMKELTFDDDFDSFISEKTFDAAAGTTVKLAQGPDGKIYQLTFYPGELSVIGPTSGNRTPTAVITATPAYGPAPLTVDFSSAGSTDPEGAPLTYTWDFGDGTGSAEANPTGKTYASAGSYAVKLIVSDGEKSSAAMKNVVVGSTPPAIVSITPDNDSLYSAGDTISFSATATDGEDGALPDSAYHWTVEFHHADHVHPFADNIVGPSGSVTIPRDESNLPNTWYRLTLTVTDSTGLSTSQSVDIRPRLVNLTVYSNDPDAVYTIDGVPFTGTYSGQAVVGVEHAIGATSPQYLNGRQVVFTQWSDGGAQTHTITTPGSDTTYTVIFSDYVPHERVTPLAVLGQVAHNQVDNVLRLADGLTKSVGIVAGTLAALPFKLVGAVVGALQIPAQIPAILSGLVGDLVGALASVPNPILGAVTDVLSTTWHRAGSVADAVATHLPPIADALLAAPGRITQAFVDGLQRILYFLSQTDPAGILGGTQYLLLSVQNELSAQFDNIVGSIGDLQHAVATALSAPLPVTV